MTGLTTAKSSWEPMKLVQVGSFSDVLQGNSGGKNDGGSMKM